MPINYILVERGDPRDFSLPKKIYAQSKSKGEVTLRELSKKISSISTVSSIDIMAVLEALLQIIPEELADSNIVRLGDFGSFYTTTQSSGAEKEKNFNFLYLTLHIHLNSQ